MYFSCFKAFNVIFETKFLVRKAIKFGRSTKWFENRILYLNTYLCIMWRQ